VFWSVLAQLIIRTRPRCHNTGGRARSTHFLYI
jgi:hypothetical protein